MKGARWPRPRLQFLPDKLAGYPFLREVQRPEVVSCGFQVTAALTAPDRVTAGDAFKVDWTGPDNPRDFIAVAPAGSPPRTWPSYEYTSRGNPTTLIAPLEAGEYELRYQTGAKYTILASTPVRIDPASKPPGRLRVLAHGSSESGSTADLPEDDFPDETESGT